MRPAQAQAFADGYKDGRYGETTGGYAPPTNALYHTYDRGYERGAANRNRKAQRAEAIQQIESLISR